MATPWSQSGIRKADVFIALLMALAAQAAIAFALKGGAAKAQTRAEISDENAQPMGVAITPMLDPNAPLLKLGDPNAMPANWARKPSKVNASSPNQKPVAKPSLPEHTNTKPHAPVVSTHGQSTTDHPQTHSSSPPPADSTTTATTASSEQATTTTPDSTNTTADAGNSSNSASKGSQDGVAHGTETDPLKARAVGLYRAQIDAWFSGRFRIRGKVPFEKLKTLASVAVIQVTADRRVGSFSASKTGDDAFDGEVQRCLSEAQSSGAVLPAPPPLYPDILEKSLSIRFRCVTRAYCE